MDGYRLDIGQMGVLIDNLTQAAENISGANDTLKNATPQQLGSHEIDQAGRAFQDRWEYGTGKIAESAENMVGALQQTQREYQRVEEEVSRIFSAGGIQAGDTSPAADPASAISAALDGGE